MPLIPNIKTRTTFLKLCAHCSTTLTSDNFAETHSLFYKDGHLPVCNSCLTKFLKQKKFAWPVVDKLCQWADIPFVPREFERIHDQAGDNVWAVYANIFKSDEYAGLGWEDYFKEFQKLKENNEILEQLPLLDQNQILELQKKWGANYSAESLFYLENLYNGLCSSQNVVSALQVDQALKICKLSLEIDNRIRDGVDFDKMLASYDKIVKTADFTPRAAKNANDFDSVGEILKWLEKRGWRAKFYDNVTRDIVDETIKNIQAWNQRLYTDESGIGDEITRRIEALKTAQKLENDSYYIEDNNSADALDKYSNDGFNKLLDDEEFKLEVD